MSFTSRDTRGVVMYNQLLNALASNRFQSLQNNGDGWTISYIGENNEAKVLTSDTIDILVDRWMALVDVLDGEE